MKRMLAFIMFMLLATTVLAHESDVKAGVGPGSMLWGLDRALENIKLLLTFSSSERARVGLQIAEERLAEAREAHEANETKHEDAAMAQYVIALHRVQRQVEKDTEDKVLIADVDEALTEQQDELESLSLSDDVKKSREDIAESVLDRKKALGIYIAPKVEEEPEEEETPEAPARTNDTIETKLLLNVIAIKRANGTHVNVSGDINDEFDVNATTLGGITAAIAAKLGVTEGEVSSALMLKDAANDLKITGVIEGEEISRVTVTQNGKVTKIVLAITDKQSVIREVAKRTGLDEMLIEENIEWSAEDNAPSNLSDPDADD